MARLIIYVQIAGYFFNNDIPRPTSAPARRTPPPAMATPFNASENINDNIDNIKKLIAEVRFNDLMLRTIN